MKFINFNQHWKDSKWNLTWIAWNKQYLQSINAKVTSLQDYMIYNNPEYVIFNSPSNDYFTDITQGINPLQEDIKWENEDKEQQISLFYPTRLNWHQGFYNQSQYGDGVFVFPVSIDNSVYYLINWYEDISLPDHPYVHRYGWRADEQQWYQIPEYGIGGGFGTPAEPDVFTLPHEALDFKSGYVCILNKQPIGVNNEFNSIKQSLDSYLIAPIGNGAYYTLNTFSKSIIAQYVPNNLDNFINQVRINLGYNLRYAASTDVYLTGVNSIDNRSGVFALSNIGIDNKNNVVDLIADHVGNVWTGGDELVAQTAHYTTKEEVFMDVTYDTYSSQLERYLIHNFNVSTTEKITNFKNSKDQTISMIQLQLF